MGEQGSQAIRGHLKIIQQNLRIVGGLFSATFHRVVVWKLEIDDENAAQQSREQNGVACSWNTVGPTATAERRNALQTR